MSIEPERQPMKERNAQSEVSEPRGQWRAPASLGLLLGVLVGMSQSEVVAPLVGAMSVAGLALVGLVKEGGGRKSDPSKSQATPKNVPAFAMACLVGVLVGNFTSNYGLLSPSPNHMRSRIVASGVDEATATEILRSMIEKNPDVLRSVLKSFSGDGADDMTPSKDVSAVEMRPRRMSTSKVVLEEYEKRGGRWKEIALFAKRFAPSSELERIEFLDFIWKVKCDY